MKLEVVINRHIFSDKITVNCCKLLGKNIENIYTGALELFLRVNTPLNIERAEKFKKLINI